MLVGLFLILTTIHGNIKGPSSRGFSYVEVWYTGMFIPIIIAILEYALLLAFLKYRSETQLDNWLIGKVPMRKFLAHIDMVFLCLNAIFMVCFVAYFFSILPHT